jgi:hypothetical protein
MRTRLSVTTGTVISPLAVDARAVSFAARTLMPMRRASSLVRAMELAPVSTRKRTWVLLTLAVAQ